MDLIFLEKNTACSRHSSSLSSSASGQTWSLHSGCFLTFFLFEDKTTLKYFCPPLQLKTPLQKSGSAVKMQQSARMFPQKGKCKLGMHGFFFFCTTCSPTFLPSIVVLHWHSTSSTGIWTLSPTNYYISSILLPRSQPRNPHFVLFWFVCLFCWGFFSAGIN